MWSVGPPMIGGAAKQSAPFKQIYVGVVDKLQGWRKAEWQNLKLIVVDEADDMLAEGLDEFHGASAAFSPPPPRPI